MRSGVVAYLVSLHLTRVVLMVFFAAQSYPGFGYLQRAVVTRLMAPTTLIDDGEGDHDLLEVQDIEQDPSAVVTNGDARDNCTVTFSICLSPTYRVPVLYFTAHKSSTCPVQRPCSSS